MGILLTFIDYKEKKTSIADPKPEINIYLRHAFIRVESAQSIMQNNFYNEIQSDFARQALTEYVEKNNYKLYNVIMRNTILLRVIYNEDLQKLIDQL